VRHNTLSAGESNAAALASFAKGHSQQQGELVARLEGQMSAQQRWLLGRMLGQVKFLEQEIAVYDQQLAELMRPFEPALERLDTIDGVGPRTVEVILAGLGPEMSEFPDSDHAASWAGMSPGNNESAGKRKSGKTAGGNKWLRRALSKAYAGARKNDSYLKAQFWRLSGRLGENRY
jgi:transposase